MASASQAMQVSPQKRVNIHHWLNLCVCVTYMIFTGWWFIWALRKSWPSVSDQFSFTWRYDELKNDTGSNASIMSSNPNYGVINKRPDLHHLTEHYTLWSPGFNSIYVIQRTMAMIYYFIYLRSSFLVLNSQKIDKFVEMKRDLMRRLREERMTKGIKKKFKKRGIHTHTASTFERSYAAPYSDMHLDLDQYLTAGTGFSVENEDSPREVPMEHKARKKQSSVLWADQKDAKSKKASITANGQPEFDVDNENYTVANDSSPEKPSREVRHAKPKGKRRRVRDADVVQEDD